jgi:hypothetical protein
MNGKVLKLASLDAWAKGWVLLEPAKLLETKKVFVGHLPKKDAASALGFAHATRGSKAWSAWRLLDDCGPCRFLSDFALVFEIWGK